MYFDKIGWYHDKNMLQNPNRKIYKYKYLLNSNNKMRLTNRLRRVGDYALNTLKNPFTYLVLLSSLYGCRNNSKEPDLVYQDKPEIKVVEKEEGNNQIRTLDGKIINISGRDTTVFSMELDTNRMREFDKIIGKNFETDPTFRYLGRSETWHVYRKVEIENNGNNYSFEIYRPNSSYPELGPLFNVGDSVRINVKGDEVLGIKRIFQADEIVPTINQRKVDVIRRSKKWKKSK